MKLKLTIQQLEKILNAAQVAHQNNPELSSTVEIKLHIQSNFYLDGDTVSAVVKNTDSNKEDQSIYYHSM